MLDKNWSDVSIVEIEHLGNEQCYDIEVMSEDHLYCLENGIINSNSHSTAYAYISYQTAWLKTYFTTEFICAILTSNSQKDDEVFEISRDLFTKEYPKLKILPVDVNKSKFTFFPEKELEIRSPFDCIKGFSSKSSENIIKNQPYSSVYDFMVRAGGDLNKNELKILQEKNAFGTLAESEIVAREILSYQKMTSMNVKGKKTDINSKLLF